jgi:hypothetical protein
MIFLSKLSTAAVFLFRFSFFPGEDGNHSSYCLLPSSMLVIVVTLASEWIEAFFNGQDIEVNCHFFHVLSQHLQ